MNKKEQKRASRFRASNCFDLWQVTAYMEAIFALLAYGVNERRSNRPADTLLPVELNPCRRLRNRQGQLWQWKQQRTLYHASDRNLTDNSVVNIVSDVANIIDVVITFEIIIKVRPGDFFFSKYIHKRNLLFFADERRIVN